MLAPFALLCKELSDIVLTFLCFGFIWAREKVCIETELLVHMETSCEEMENFLQRAEICARELAVDLWVACLVSLCCLLPLCLKLMGVVYIL